MLSEEELPDERRRHTMQAANLIFPARVSGPRQRSPRSLSRSKVLGALTAVLATIALCSCELVEAVAGNMFTLTVVNRCSGPDFTVDVTISGIEVGSVTYSGTFLIFTGPVTLRAVGTGRNGHVFERTTYVTGDLVWTLCSSTSNAVASSAEDPPILDSLDEQE